MSRRLVVSRFWDSFLEGIRDSALDFGGRGLGSGIGKPRKGAKEKTWPTSSTARTTAVGTGG